MAAETEKTEKRNNAAAGLAPAQLRDFLYDKPYTCPCCDAKFKERTVRTDELVLVNKDSDLRPHYEPLNPIFYDIVICKSCGYASLSKTFENLSFIKSQIIVSQISPRFNSTLFPQILTLEIAIERYKTALLTAMLTRGRTSEIAYLCMRLAWLYREKGDKPMEDLMLLSALDGFSEALSKEYFPYVDLDEETTLYIMGDFLRRLGRENDAKLFFSDLLKKEKSSQRMKKIISEHGIV